MYRANPLSAATASTCNFSAPFNSSSVAPDSFPKAVTASAKASTFSSVVLNLSTASSTILFVARRASTPPASFLYFETSVWALLSRVWYLMSSELILLVASLPLASICRWVINLRASIKTAVAADSAFKTASAASRISEAESAKSCSSFSNGAPASATCFARPSALVTSTAASCMRDFAFLVWVAAFNSLSLATRESSCNWNSLSFSSASWLGPFEKRLASTSFVAMNMRAIDICVFAAVTPSSHA
mmetsp:Transcript_52648/g.146669  ORF Transcript_52648/g.146669 Transcript_52648/m.146669 type:complete len:246 (-) Transcript_52648:1675-2412(-)